MLSPQIINIVQSGRLLLTELFLWMDQIKEMELVLKRRLKM